MSAPATLSAWIMRRQRRLLDLACVCALVGLALVVWSIVDPRPVPVVLAMSMAQGVGTLSFVIYLVVVLAELRQTRVLGERDEGP